MSTRAGLINIRCDIRAVGVSPEHCGRGLTDSGACTEQLWAWPGCTLGVASRLCGRVSSPRMRAGGTGAAMAHGHGPGRCRCCGEEAAERGAAWGLYLRIDRQRLQCLNERREGSGATVFRPWEERGDRSQFVESDDDEELLFNIPFTGSVKLKGVIVMGEDDGTHPAEMRLFRNIPHMSFDDTAKEAEQTFSLSRDPLGELEYPTKIARFSNVYHLSMHFPKNFGAETTKIFYIGLKGEWTEAHRHEVTICNYEASANPADHKLEQITPQTHFIS